MINPIKFITRSINFDRLTSTYTFEVPNNAIDTYSQVKLLDTLIDALAQKYIEDHGAEILSAIHAKTVDSKVIQKVIERLRTELKAQK